MTSGVRPQPPLAAHLPRVYMLLVVNAWLFPDQDMTDWDALIEGAIGGEGWTESLYLFRRLFPGTRIFPGKPLEVVGSALGCTCLLALMIIRLCVRIVFFHECRAEPCLVRCLSPPVWRLMGEAFNPRDGVPPAGVWRVPSGHRQPLPWLPPPPLFSMRADAEGMSRRYGHGCR